MLNCTFEWARAAVIGETQTIQADRISSALTATEFALRGRRGGLFVLDAGSARLIGDAGETGVEAPCLIWLPVGATARLRLWAGTRGFSLRLTETAIGRAMPTGVLSGQIRRAIGAQVLVFDTAGAGSFGRLRGLFDEIEAELSAAAPGSDAAVQMLVSLALIHIWRAAAPKIERPVPLPSRIVQDFLGLVELNLTQHWSVGQYADALGVSRDRLNAAVRRAIGRTPHAHIQARLIDETKTLLLQSDLQMAEIAYRLGFNDAAYFNRFFQRHEDLPPGRYRRLHRPSGVEKDERASYAAWP